MLPGCAKPLISEMASLQNLARTSPGVCILIRLLGSAITTLFLRRRPSQRSCSCGAVCVPPLVRRRKHAAYRELSQRLERHEKLSSLAGKLEQDKQLMGKGRKRKMTAVAEDGSSTAVFKWKRERKK